MGSQITERTTYNINIDVAYVCIYVRKEREHHIQISVRAADCVHNDPNSRLDVK